MIRPNERMMRFLTVEMHPTDCFTKNAPCPSGGPLEGPVIFLHFYASASLRAPVHPPPPPAVRNIDFITTKCDKGCIWRKGPLGHDTAK